MSSSEVRRAVGLIWLSEGSRALLPTILAAIEQAKFVNKYNGLVWLKTLADGTQRALVIYIYGPNSRIKPLNILGFAQNSIIVTHIEDKTPLPVFISSLIKKSPHPQESPNTEIKFDLPPLSGPAMECTLMYRTISIRVSALNRGVVEHIHAAPFTKTKYFITASSRHQHQLALLLDNITQAYEPRSEKRVMMYRFKKESPNDLPQRLTDALAKLGLEGHILLKTESSRLASYYVLEDLTTMIVGMLFPESISRSISPWLLGRFSACLKYIVEMYHYPNNRAIQREIGDVIYLLQMWPFSPNLCDIPGHCSIPKK